MCDVKLLISHYTLHIAPQTLTLHIAALPLDVADFTGCHEIPNGTRNTH